MIRFKVHAKTAPYSGTGAPPKRRKADRLVKGRKITRSTFTRARPLRSRGERLWGAVVKAERAVIAASKAFVKAAMLDHPAAFIQAWGAPQGQKLRVTVARLEKAMKAVKAKR